MAIIQKKNSKKKEDILKKSSYLYHLAIVIAIVFLVYSFSLSRTWQPFDEALIYKEELLPIPTSFRECFEVIKAFVINYHTLSMNSFFSNYVTLRSNQVASMLIVFVSFFFKKSFLLYHLLQLIIHLINSILVFFIIKDFIQILKEKKSLNNLELIIASTFTLIWALHSANTEAILLVTNWTTLLTYSFCFLFILLEIKNLEKSTFSIFHLLLKSLSFCVLMLFTEYAYTLPLIIFFIILSTSTLSKKKAFIIATQKTAPYILGLLFFILLSIINPNSTITSLFNHQLNSSTFQKFVERSLWLSPQIFLSFFKLFFVPKVLSTYQSNLIYLSNSLLSPFSIFSMLFYISVITTPLILFLFSKNSSSKYLPLLILSFFFSLFPFLHIIAPTYCLIADRYCYFPLFFLVLIIITACLPKVNLKSLLFFLSIILVTLTIRTIVRISDWQNPVSFYNSVLRAEKAHLYKGQKLLIFADFLDSHKMQPQMESTIKNSLSEFNLALHKLTHLKEKHPNQPLTLKLYGLDYDSLSLKAAHGIAIIKKNYEKESTGNIVSFFEPYIEKRLDYSAPNEIAFYGDLLLKSGNLLKAKDVYEYGYKKFPFVLDISLPLADFYFNYEKNEAKGFQILQQSYRYYPNKGMPMYKLLKYYEQKNDPRNVAKFAYLLGLRDHSIESYQHAEQIYLDLNMLKNAKKTIDKLLSLNPNNPLTLLQLSRYLDLSGQRKDILEILNKAYYINKSSDNTEAYVSKAILTSLINVNYQLGNIESTKKYLFELEQEKELSPEDIKQINLVKERLKNK